MGINLSNREAERLFHSWGFIDETTKMSSNSAGGHKFFRFQKEDGPRVAITSPGRRAVTPRRAYEKAASIVGVTLQEFLDGPPKKPQPATAEEPDPFGIKDRPARPVSPPPPPHLDVMDIRHLDKVMAVFDEHCRVCGQCAPYLGCDPWPLAKAGQIPAELEHYENPPTAEEVARMNATAEKVLGAVMEAHEPITSHAIASKLGLSITHTRHALTQLQVAGDIHNVGTQPASGGKGGRAATLWWWESTYQSPETPEEEPVTTALVQASLQREAEASVALDKGDHDGHTISLPQDTRPEAARPLPVVVESPKVVRIFEETEIRWPTGGIVIKDDAGNLYVARPLVEEGR